MTVFMGYTGTQDISRKAFNTYTLGADGSGKMTFGSVADPKAVALTMIRTDEGSMTVALFPGSSAAR